MTDYTCDECGHQAAGDVSIRDGKLFHNACVETEGDAMFTVARRQTRTGRANVCAPDDETAERFAEQLPDEAFEWERVANVGHSAGELRYDRKDEDR